MSSANRPSGPGKALNERRDAVTEREELDELAVNTGDDEQAAGAAAERSARNADRDAREPQSPNKPGKGERA